ncbi:hypothetical protein [Paraburkholderia sp.]|uniref:hypothetical protein n=1 Tax=Paraburkholderia sp. TaxID=1926495 RepID=UPI002F3E8633
MKNILCALLVWFFFNGIAGAEYAPDSHDERQENIDLLSNQCGYALDEDIASKITISSINKNEKVVSFDFYTLVKLVDRPIQGKLSFGCFVTGANTLTPGAAQKRTAADVITSEDSGGRYARKIAWQRKYEGNGWVGTIAYVNSVFGDQVRLASPDYFLICPDKRKFPCFSFEALNKRLNRKEADRIPKMLGGIGIIDSPSTTPETSGK